MRKELQVVAISLLLLGISQGGKRITFGGGLLYDLVYTENGDFLSDSSDHDSYGYVEADLTAKADFGKGVSIFTRLRAWGFYRSQFYNAYDMDEVMVEANEFPRLYEAYLQIEDFFDLPIDVKVGRQFFRYGDGLLIFDTGQFGLHGVRLNFHPTEDIGFDLFSIRQNSLYHNHKKYGDEEVYGLYGFLKFGEMDVELEPYFMQKSTYQYATIGILSVTPMWFGARIVGSPVENLSLKGEFAMMGGEKETEKAEKIDYKGMAFTGEINYSLPNGLSFGGGYFSFSGDDPATKEDEEWSNALGVGNYIFDNFFNGWVGFGEAMTWAMYDSRLRPGETFDRNSGFEHFNIFWLNPTNLNVINAHLSYEPIENLVTRLDVFNFSLNKSPDNYSAQIGNEVDINLYYNYKDVIGLGLSGGYLIPGDRVKDVLGSDHTDGAICLRLWVYKTFEL